MRKVLANRPSPAMAVAFVALLAALSGTAIALPGKNTVDSADIKNKQVKGKDLASNAVTSAKVKDNNLTGADVFENSLTGADVNESTLGQVPSASTAGSAATAGSASTADNADKLDGLDANQLVRGTTQTGTGVISDFDAAAFTDLVSRSVTAPTDGILLIWGQVNVNRDSSDADPVELEARGALDGAPATAEANVRATQSATNDQSVSVSGAVPVTAGPHTVSLQAREVGPGVAFLTERSVTTLFVPFGDTGTPGILSRSAQRRANR